jgi:carbon-monoxide dehydrogenase medium subunit
MQYFEPESLQEVFYLLERYEDDARLLAGGTGLINLMKQRLVLPGYLIGLRKLAKEHSGIQRQDGGIKIGALTTHWDVEHSSVVKEVAPLLAETEHHVATVRIRNVATVGGGLAHADPNMDPPPAYIALDAKITATSRGGSREVPAEQFFKDYYETALGPGEVVTAVTVPAQPARTSSAYMKFLPRTADDYATVSVAARLTLGEDGQTVQDARIALGSVASTPVRATAAENVLKGQKASQELFRAAAAEVPALVDPISDFRGSAEYKRDMSAVFTRRALEQALARASH